MAVVRCVVEGGVTAASTLLSQSAAERTLHMVQKRFGVRSGSSARASRNDLPQLTRDLGFTRGAEIGVWKGAYSAAFCRGNRALHMDCVDPWLSYPAWLDTKNHLPPDEAARFIAEAHQKAVAALTGCNCTIWRMFSAQAAAHMPDRSLDFVYIDANHGYEAVLEDLTVWTPKIRPGGILAGHDYRRFTNKPTIHVVEAVDEYTRQHAIAPWFVLAADRTPSFLWVIH